MDYRIIRATGLTPLALEKALAELPPGYQPTGAPFQDAGQWCQAVHRAIAVSGEPGEIRIRETKAGKR